jgi:hypothetical protein
MIQSLSGFGAKVVCVRNGDLKCYRRKFVEVPCVQKPAQQDAKARIVYLREPKAL